MSPQPPPPPLSTALHVVLAAHVDGTSRPALLAAICDRTSHREPSQASPAPAVRHPEPITRMAQRATSTQRLAATAPGAASGMGTGMGTSLATVLTLPRVIPLPRAQSGDSLDDGPGTGSADDSRRGPQEPDDAA